MQYMRCAGEKYPPNLIWIMPAKGSLGQRRNRFDPIDSIDFSGAAPSNLLCWLL
jgi:hypothetical protein